MIELQRSIADKLPRQDHKSLLNREWRYIKHHYQLLVLFVPAFILIFLVCYMPMFGLVIAFKNFRVDLGIFGSEWAGFKNFEFFFKSSDAWRLTRNTIGYNMLFIVLGTSFSVILAIFLNEVSKGWFKLYQSVLFFPYFLSWVVIGYLGLSLLDSSYGIVNQALTSLGVERVNWYNDPTYWPFIIVFSWLWKFVGFNTLLYYTGIMGINKEYYEAASIDGASRFRMAWSITVPLLKPLIIILFILALGNIFRGDFGLHYFMPNQSGILNSTVDVLDTYSFRALRQLGDVGMSSAVTFFQSVVGLVTVVTANWVIRKIDRDSGLF